MVGSAGGAGTAWGVGQGALVTPPVLVLGLAQQQAHLPAAAVMGQVRRPRAHCPAEAGSRARNKSNAGNQLVHRNCRLATANRSVMKGLCCRSS